MRDFKEKIEDMSKEEKEKEQPNKIANIVEKILKFNWEQSGQGLKILTPSQMLNRLTIYLAQSKAGSNLKEKIRN